MASTKRGRLVRGVASGQAEYWVSMVDDPTFVATNDYVELYVEVYSGSGEKVNVKGTMMKDFLCFLSTSMGQRDDLWPIGDWEMLGDGMYTIHASENANMASSCAMALNNSNWRDYRLKTGTLVTHWL